MVTFINRPYSREEIKAAMDAYRYSDTPIYERLMQERVGTVELPFCLDCSDHEACMTGYPCEIVKGDQD